MLPTVFVLGWRAARAHQAGQLTAPLQRDGRGVFLERTYFVQVGCHSSILFQDLGLCLSHEHRMKVRGDFGGVQQTRRLEELREELPIQSQFPGFLSFPL